MVPVIERSFYTVDVEADSLEEAMIKIAAGEGCCDNWEQEEVDSFDPEFEHAEVRGEWIKGPGGGATLERIR